MASRVFSRLLLSRFPSPLLRGSATLRPILRTNPMGRPPTVRFTATTASSITPAPRLSLSQRLKVLSKEYGYSAMGVYFGLSVLDFPFCFLAVRFLGADRIGRWEKAAMGFVRPYWNKVRDVFGFPAAPEVVPALEEEHDRLDNIGDGGEGVKKSASLWTELVLAYAIHKSFIFLRVPLTAAVTPKVVRVLRGWGWDIGRKGKPKISMPGKKTPPPPVV